MVDYAVTVSLGGISPGTGEYLVTAYGAVGDGVTDDTGAIQNCIDACIAAGGGRVRIPKGDYSLVGTTGDDGIKHGIHVPFTAGGIEGGSTSIVICGDGAESRLIAASASMYVVRYTGNNSAMSDLAIVGNYTSSGLVLTSSDTTADVGDEQISYNAFSRLQIAACGENGILLQCPLGSSPGGCYYNTFSDIYIFNSATGATPWSGRGIYMRELAASGSNGSNNRNTFRSVIMKRLNTGIQIDDGDTNSFYSCHFESIAGTSTPNATPTAVIIGPAVYRSVLYNRFFGCQTETVTRGFENNGSRTELYGCDFRDNLMTVAPLILIGGNDSSIQGTYFNGWAREQNTLACSVDQTKMNVGSIRHFATKDNSCRQQDYLGYVAGNGTVKTLTITFDTALAGVEYFNAVIDVTFFGNFNGWNARGVKRIVSYMAGNVTTNPAPTMYDVTAYEVGALATAGVVVRTGASYTAAAIVMEYTFDAADADDSSIHVVTEVFTGSHSATDSNPFTMVWS